MTSLRQAIAECAAVLMAEDHGRFTIEALVVRVRADHPGTWKDHAMIGVENDARHIAKDLMRRWTGNERVSHQPQLPGLHLPSAIAVRTETDGIYYVSTPKAVWHELMAGEAERTDNIATAIENHRVYTASCDVVRPLMEADPDLTLEQAIERLRDMAAS